MPVLIGAVEAILEEKFNVGGVQATLSCAAPLLIVNGPYAGDIGLHGGLGLLRPREPRQRDDRGAPSGFCS